MTMDCRNKDIEITGLQDHSERVKKVIQSAIAIDLKKGLLATRLELDCNEGHFSRNFFVWNWCQFLNSTLNMLEKMTKVMQNLLVTWLKLYSNLCIMGIELFCAISSSHFFVWDWFPAQALYFIILYTNRCEKVS